MSRASPLGGVSLVLATLSHESVRLSQHAVLAALCAGLGASTVARPAAYAWVPAAALALGAVAAAGRTIRFCLLAGALALFGWWWGGLRLAALDDSTLAAHVGDSVRAVVEVAGPARRGLFRQRVPARAHSFRAREVDEPVLLELPLGRSPPQGARLRIVAEIRAPRPPERGFDEREWLRRQGIHVVLQVAHWEIVGRRGGVAGLADRIRARIERSLAPGVGGERRAVLAGVVLGADEGLSRELRDRFRASGLYHLLAVSGQNVAFIVGGVLLVAWLLGVPRWMGELGALAAIGSYVLAVGLQPSVVRAGIAGALASLAWLLARPRDRWYFLLLGAAALLAWNPYNLLEPGFQLSFGAVLAIFLLVPRLERLLEGYPVPKLVGTTLAVSAACGIATAPIVLLQFGEVPIYSVVSNALAAPVVAPLLGLAFLTAALEPVVPGAAAVLAWVNGWLAAYLAACARLIGDLPHAQVSSHTALAIAGGALALPVLARRLPTARRTPALGLAALSLAAGVAWQLRPGPSPPPPPQGLRMTFLDVGQGDATLIQVPEGAILVDQGPPEAELASRLRRLGVSSLDLLVLTHPSRDNIGGAEAVIRELEIGRVLDPHLPFANPFGAPVLAEARRRGIPVDVTRAGRVYRLGRLTLRVLWPPARPPPSSDPNDHATVLLATYGSLDALLPADAESNVTLPARPPPVEVLKVGHHGSADDGLPELLRRVHPSIAVVSVGSRNDYGHPAPSTVAALRADPRIQLFRTDRDGDVVIEAEREGLRVRTQR